MAKALVGHIANDHLLRAEIASLRAKVGRLQAELAQLRADQVVELPTVVEMSELESELAEIQHATPALTS